MRALNIKTSVAQGIGSPQIGDGLRVLLPLTEEGTYTLYENVSDGKMGTASDQVSEAFKASTLQFILTWTF